MPLSQGTTVSVHYTGTLADNTTFDSSKGREPLTFTIGKQQMIPGFEQAVISMSVGDKKTITVPCEQAYGQKKESYIIEIQKTQLPPGEPSIGMMLIMKTPEQMELPGVITQVKESTVLVDFNHPLAGKDLTFEIELLSAN
jgi:peptidylprolyl isomerase